MRRERQILGRDLDAGCRAVCWPGEELRGGRAASEVAKRNGLGEGKTPPGTREMPDRLCFVLAGENLPARRESVTRERHESGQLAVHVPDAFEPGDDLLADVATFCVIDMGAVEAGFRRQRFLGEIVTPAWDSRFQANDLDQLGAEK